MRIEEAIHAGNIDVPKVGDKCTMHFYSDSHACQVVRVAESGKTIWIRRNKVTVSPDSPGGMGHQDWVLHENEFEGNEMKITKRRSGDWREEGSGTYVALGQWHEYYDWSF